MRQLDPAVYLTVGVRRTPSGKPADQKWQVFFDNVHKQPHVTHLGALNLTHVSVQSYGRRAILSLGDYTLGPFRGVLQLVVYAGSPLLHLQAVVRTEEDRRAIIYDAGLVSAVDGWKQWVWYDTEGELHEQAANHEAKSEPLMVRHRALAGETSHGAVAVFPSPHQFFFPRDWSDNLRYVWHGREHQGLTKEYGFGIRQNKDGGGNFVPWFNAPPQTDQRLGVFFLLTTGTGRDALEQVLRYTHHDRFPELAGHRTLTSHYHMATTMIAMEQKAKGIDPPPAPDFVRMFKDMNVDMVHQGEFHGDGHQQDPGPLRLPELQAMFENCRRLSDDELLVIPGEEVNQYLGIQRPGQHPGHWMSLFPRPVYWILKREEAEPFVEQHPDYGKVYRVGSTADMQRLIAAEGALVWTAHPRIKASSWTPDIFRNESYYLDDSWLGGAWKHMPGDLSQVRLGIRVLDLLDDMANWSVATGSRKYVLGEVDVFRLNQTHELYGHMNINYVRLDELPRFDEGWQPVLDALRTGKFWVTTGEVLLHHYSVDGRGSGESLPMPDDGRLTVTFDVEWTFPLSFALIASGDGERVYHELVDLTETTSFGRRTVEVPGDFAGRHWVRVEVWDVAGNGAFTQPVWIDLTEESGIRP